MNRTIEIIIAPNGQTKVETKDFVGAKCRDASRFIELALGQQTDELLKAEFHQTASNQQHVRQGE
ncbi:DUF2997 domain-containing protein [Blastopirellula sp. JC732]|uniref:DUF2997 domain-containing protein n=1 Tax=Blastopirellula sediminis TaxID=2894196 RepID=A0A9X1MPR6_9BACT|nr:DUF2997 domain-containing protein [Blastopirellula sediminis]MCC9606221.1 DUF2997 domain-containing protein [Blastopirellula sediminis]MCC9630481.1 DUF2997 domain-containing protein [Blastopirellula sediminis]